MREFRTAMPAKWITIEDTPELGRVDTVWFRRVFSCEAGEELEIRISACSRYKLYVNGTFAAYGPCKGGEGYQYFDCWNLAEFLVSGRNELLVEVVSFPDVVNPMEQVGGPDWSVNLLRCAALAVVGTSAAGEELTTGLSDWQCHRCAAMTPVRNRTAFWLGYMERVDLAGSVQVSQAASLEWRGAKACASVNPGAYGELSRLPAYERPIPPLELGERKTLSKPAQGTEIWENGRVTIAPRQRVDIELDAGAEETAFVFLRGHGGRGASVRIRYAEAYFEPDGKHKDNRLPGDGRALQGYADEIFPAGGEFEYAPFWFRTFRFVRLEIETGQEELTLFAPQYSATHYPLRPVSQVRRDASGWIAPLWDVSLRTLRCCMHETFEDCPYYEQMQYTMDTRLQMLFAYRVAADTGLARRTLFDFHASQLPSGILQSRCPSNSKQVIPAFALHWIFMLRDFYEQTGDAAQLRRYFGTMDSVLGYFRDHRGAHGLVENLGYWEFMDWVAQWERGAPQTDGLPEGSHNFLYAYALGVAAEIARILGFAGVASEYEAEKAEILRLAHEAFFDAARGLYRYHPAKAEFCQHTQVWAVLAGVRDAAFRRQLMETVDADDSLLPCSFPMQYYLFRAYEATGLYARTERLWALWKRVLEQNLTTVPENPTDTRSDCHAWGALLLYEYPARMLGVRPAAPGWKEILVKPAALFLGQAEGRACVPDGYIDVKWARREDTFRLECELQTDSAVRLELPDGSSAQEQGRGKRVAAECRL